MSEPEALSLYSQAELGAMRQPEHSQFAHLIRHFLERFFNHETASPDGDAKARLVLIAVAAGLPGFVIALYLWPVYHHFIHYPPPHHPVPGPPYWLQVNHHFFYVIYSFAVMGIVTVFEWDMFFPDRLDLFVLQTLPIAARTMFMARVSAISILIAGFLFDTNVLAPLALPAAIDPPNIFGFLAGHLLAVACSGLFAVALLLAFQGLLISVLGERLFRKLSLPLQGLIISALIMLLLLFPVLSGAVPVLLQSGSTYARYFPPFWFLGMYQRLFEGPTALPIYLKLAQTGFIALIVTAALAILTYPIAYLRRSRALIEGVETRHARRWMIHPVAVLLHATLLRRATVRAVFHFITQSILRVPRYRIYLVLYGGVGVAIVCATVVRMTVANDHVRIAASTDGIRAAAGIVAFWLIAGLRVAFVSPGNQQGNWAFRFVQGKPPQFEIAIEQSTATTFWILLWAIAFTWGICLALRSISPAAMLSGPATVSQFLVAAGLCVLLTDLFLLDVTIVPFTGDVGREHSNLATTVLKYCAFVPLVAWIPVASEPWVQTSIRNLGIAVGGVALVHLLLRSAHRRILREYCNAASCEVDGEEFPMKLGLRD